MQETIKMSFIEAIKNQADGFRFGTLWRLNEEVLGGVVPILRDKDFERGYQLIEEVKEKEVYQINDTGHIDKIKIKMLGDTPIFIRSGTAFKGQGTQSRAAETSVIIMPDKTNPEVEIPVRCIHASHGISSGSGFERYGYVPREVEESLVGKSGQSATWNNVRCSSARIMGLRSVNNMAFGEGHFQMGALSDSMIDNLENVKAGKSKIKEIMKQMPCLEQQVGVVIFDEKGVYAIEVFDHPDSWKAFHENIIDKYEDILTKESKEALFELKKEVIPKKITAFIAGLLKCVEEQTYSQKSSATYTLSSEGYIGEYSTIDNGIIHLLGLRKEQTGKKKPTKFFGWSDGPTIRQRPYTNVIRTNGPLYGEIKGSNWAFN